MNERKAAGWNAGKLADDQVAAALPTMVRYATALRALRSIANSSCCTPCQEARNVARQALRDMLESMRS